MQIAINIPKEIYEEIKTTKSVYRTDAKILCNAIMNGTPLPKGHGKLIAEPTEEDIAKTIGGQNDFTECIKDAVKAVFDNASTIIETDISGKEIER